MAGRGSQTFKKRQKEQQRKERQQEKMAKRLQPKGENEPRSTDELAESSRAMLERELMAENEIGNPVRSGS